VVRGEGGPILEVDISFLDAVKSKDKAWYDSLERQID
jgi:hypothetical protein